MFRIKTVACAAYLFLSLSLNINGGQMPLEAINAGSAGDIQQQGKVIPQGNIQVVIIKTNGNCKINNYASGDIDISATLTSSGSVWGWKTNNTPPLRIIAEKHGDTLYVSTTPFNLVYTFGISTYVETMQMDISLPATVKTVLIHCKNELVLDLRKTAIAGISFKAHEELKIEGAINKYSDSKNFEFEYAGTGLQNFVLQAGKIHAKMQ
ncbi:MAG: hypothetical protein HYV28_14490 [Ignavibacteriales bacterium]|nr:hypothetical protein [Ignavibacteriales bacterium]